MSISSSEVKSVAFNYYHQQNNLRSLWSLAQIPWMNLKRREIGREVKRVFSKYTKNFVIFFLVLCSFERNHGTHQWTMEWVVHFGSTAPVFQGTWEALELCGSIRQTALLTLSSLCHSHGCSPSLQTSPAVSHPSPLPPLPSTSITRLLTIRTGLWHIRLTAYNSRRRRRKEPFGDTNGMKTSPLAENG